MTAIDIEALRALVDKCEALRLSGPLSLWGSALCDLSRAMTPGTVSTLLTELAAARAELTSLRETLNSTHELMLRYESERNHYRELAMALPEGAAGREAARAFLDGAK